jgi:hypothetical protein
MSCTSCGQQKEHNEAKLTAVKRKANDQAKSQGLSSYVIYKTVNDNPGFMWSAPNNPTHAHLTVYEYCTVI